ncbi:MAG TPA: choice-of-anchor G family protein [Galbitalea sp.]|nr:choice-of-anchor G family protein [Galbitalea sp.]
MNRLGTQLRKVRTAGGIAGLAITALVAASIPGVALTNASWNDQEFVHSAIGTEDCSSATNFTTHAAGKLLSGTILNTNLDNVADLDGVVVTNGPSGIGVLPSNTPSLGADAYANPLDVSALNSVNLSLGSLLQLPLDTKLGVVGQYAQAHTNGNSTGASGAITDSGGIALSNDTPSPSVPTFATLDLSTVLNDLDLSSVSNLAGLKVTLGAVSSDETLYGCDALWQRDIAANLTRGYHIAGLTTTVDSPLVGLLTTKVQGATTDLGNAVENISSLQGDVVDGITGPLNGLLSVLGLGTVSATLSASADFSGVNSVLGEPIADSNGIVSIDLADGTITINTAALFDSANGLNEQDPNTQLLINSTMINALTAAVTSALDDYIADVNTALQAAIAAVEVNVSLSIPLSALGGGGITVTGTNLKLSSLLDGTAQLSSSISCTFLPAVCALAEGTLGGLLDGTLAALDVPIGTVVDNSLTSTVTGLVNTLQGVTASVVTLLSSVTTGLFSPSSLSILINAQNAPHPANGNPLPSWAALLPGPSASPYKTGQYDISALQISIAGVLTLDLAHSSVGSNNLTP